MKVLKWPYYAVAVAIVLLRPVSSVAQPGNVTTIEVKQLSSVLGIEVRTDTERNVGRIVDLLTDGSGHIEAAIIEFGGFLGMGSRKIAIEWSAVRIETTGNRTVAILDMPRDQLRAAPEYKPEQPIVLRKMVPPTPQSETTPPFEPTAAPQPRVKHVPPPERNRRHRKRRYEE